MTMTGEQIDAGIKAHDELNAIIAEQLTKVPDNALAWLQLSGEPISTLAHAEARRRWEK